MLKKSPRTILFFSVVTVPLLTLMAPHWLSLRGVSPCWAVLWLLPWSLEEGEAFGLLSGLSLGFVLDGISLGGATHIPALTFLGFWWGRMGRDGRSIDLIWNLGLLAWIGTMIFGITIWIQILFIQAFSSISWFNNWAFNTLLAQAVLTGLIAPMICSWILLLKATPKTRYK